MAREVNVCLTNWRAAGISVPTPQYKVELRMDWLTDDGAPKTRTVTVTFPNDLQLMSVSWLKDELKDLLIRAARKRFDVDAERAP
jgi:hypothetical protein